MNRRPEVKVVAATLAPVVSGLLLWALGVLVWGTPADAAHAEAAVKAVPTYVSGAVLAAVTFALGYLSPRTSDSERAKPAAPPMEG